MRNGTGAVIKVSTGVHRVLRCPSRLGANLLKLLFDSSSLLQPEEPRVAAF
jgi:hypothetical protein